MLLRLHRLQELLEDCNCSIDRRQLPICVLDELGTIAPKLLKLLANLLFCDHDTLLTNIRWPLS